MLEFALFFGLLFYLAPFCVAAFRNHGQPGGVLLMNLLAGWTVVGWFLALAWAFAGAERARGVAPAGASSPIGTLPRILDHPGERDARSARRV